MNKQPKIYFAYGSNLNLEDMKVRCPTARLLGAGRAEGHELMFRGHTPDTSFLTVVPSPDHFVPIVAFEVYEDMRKTSAHWTTTRMCRTTSTAPKR